MFISLLILWHAEIQTIWQLAPCTPTFLLSHFYSRKREQLSCCNKQRFIYLVKYIFQLSTTWGLIQSCYRPTKNTYPFTVFKTRSFSERVPLRADHGTSALIRAGVTWFKEKWIGTSVKIEIITELEVSLSEKTRYNEPYYSKLQNFSQVSEKVNTYWT